MSLLKSQQIQEDQYLFPYHYLPQRQQGRVSLAEYWGWGMRYLGGIELVLDWLTEFRFESAIDVGCGDGRFLGELKRHFPAVRTVGVDYSERAIRFASAFNPDVAYRASDITKDPPAGRFDLVTSLEVIEHIPPPELPAFVAAMQRLLAEGGTLIVTVPHRNKAVIDKHFQHFDSDSLGNLLRPHFASIEFRPFDRRALWLKALEGLAGGRGKHVVVTNPIFLRLYDRLYRRFGLYPVSESRCERIAAICR